MPRHDAALPQHGFARTALFEWIDSHETDHATSLTFRLKSSQKYRELFPYAFELTYSVIVAEELRLELTTYNGDEATFLLTQALHSYFAVSDISKIHVSGLEGCRYIDYVNAQRQERQQGTVKIVQEVDRVYEEVTSPVELYDGVRCISVTNEGSRSVVVWNPWREKCARMRAMEPTSYRTMLCIESANAGNDVRHIDPGESHTLTAVIRSTLL
ncbi:MAG: D-hexose-6-phosphate mutarotase [Sulfurimonas sp.]|nr:MAG: D-hexose-6-phosphate mutarotase [Sulfurimonas sp.]